MKKILAATAAAALLVGGGTAFGVATLVASPEQADYSVERSADVKVEIMDPEDVLNPDDEARMRRDVERIHFAAPVKQLSYLVFKKNKDEVEDSVEEYLRDNHPDLIGDDQFTDGQLFVGVGLDPRQAFIFAGNDVARDLSLELDDGHLEDAIEEIKPGVKAGNIPAGLFAGADYAADADKVSPMLRLTAVSVLALAVSARVQLPEGSWLRWVLRGVGKRSVLRPPARIGNTFHGLMGIPHNA
ncbi:hypothetical protein ACL1FL_03805 [Corynebacterium striatum]